MEKEEMKITPQDIIDKEFKVKFRGFDMAEVDTFLEEVAESFFKLSEENTLLHEKILALQEDLEKGGGLASQAQVELPAEVSNILEDLKQDSATISAELAALKQDRYTFDALRENLEKAVASIEESRAAMTPQPQMEFPPDLAHTLEEFRQNSAAIAAELAALKEERQAIDSFRENLAEIISSAKEAASQTAPRPGHVEIPADLSKALEGFKQGTETFGAELAVLKQEVGAISGIRDEINRELQELLSSRFDEFEAKLSAASDKAPYAAPEPKAAPPGPEKKETLVAAEVAEEPAGHKEERKLPDYREEKDEDAGGGDLEFLSEDDILDVDKLRGIFQSVLDDSLNDGHDSREGDDASADLLFLEEDFIDDGHEPEVTFSLDENETEKKQN